MSKKTPRPMGDAFAAFAQETAADASNKILGNRESPEEFKSAINSDKIRRLDIFEIDPDPMQPRRAIPNEIRGNWQPGAAEIADFLQRWSDATGVDIRARLESESDEDRSDGSTPAEVALLALIDFAASIHRDGLTNAITVVSPAINTYIIETGERRWLAYHLLYRVYGEDYHYIPARLMAERDVWRQATENNARENLNAIARARQLAILLMDLHGMDNFQPLSNFEHEQDFYAQVSDGEKWRTPDGKGTEILAATGFKSKSQMRDYRSLLRLPHGVWNIADDRNIPEKVVRETMIAVERNESKAVVLLQNYRVSRETLDEDTVSGDTVSDENRVSTDTLSDEAGVTMVTAGRRGWIDRLVKQSSSARAFWVKATQDADKLSAAARSQLRTAAEEQRALLDELIAKLNQPPASKK